MFGFHAVTKGTEKPQSEAEGNTVASICSDITAAGKAYAWDKVLVAIHQMQEMVTKFQAGLSKNTWKTSP